MGIDGGTTTTPFLTCNNLAIKNAIATSAAAGMPIAIAISVGFMMVDIDIEAATGGLGFVNLQTLFGIFLVNCRLSKIWVKLDSYPR